MSANALLVEHGCSIFIFIFIGHTMEEALLDRPEDTGKEVSPALVALHPLGRFVVVAVGSGLRVFDLIENHSVACQDNTDGPFHMDAIRSICFDRDGKQFASAGDDKHVKLWNADSWHCIKTVRSEKRVSAVGFSKDGRFLMFADKFGVVWVTTTLITDNSFNSRTNNAEPLLAHCCSIITGLEVSSNGKFIATTDRDFKIRVSVFPKCPLGGAHEIQSFCLGHTNFVSCVAFLDTQPDSEGLLISGGGDATVRLWYYMTGELLDTFEAGIMVGLGKYVDEVDNQTCAIIDMSVSSDGLMVAVAMERLYGVLLLSCNLQSRKLALLEKVWLPENFIPTSLVFDSSSSNLWMVTGAAEMVQIDGVNTAESEIKATAISASAITRVRVMRIDHVESDGKLDLRVLEDGNVPGGEKLLITLQGDQTDVEAATAAAEAANIALRNLLIKREYSIETREQRKKKRNDKKHKKMN